MEHNSLTCSNATTVDDLLGAPYLMGLEKSCGCFKAYSETYGRPHEGAPTRKLGPYPRMVAKCPCQLFFINLVIILLMVAAISSDSELTENSDSDWTISSTDESNAVDAVVYSEEAIDPPQGAMDLAISERSQVEFKKNSLGFLYESDDVFSPESLENICKLESMVVGSREYQK